MRSHYVAQVAGLALLYIATGKLGLFLSVPPGFATLIWPPSGLALGICLVHGRRLWPGIWIGSFLLNAYVAGALGSPLALLPQKLAIAAAIGAGSTLQVLIACLLARRVAGLPLKLASVSQILRLFLLVGPLACVTAASVGVMSLRLSGLITDAELVNNWLSWWGGDVFGVIVFLPLALVAPGNPHPIALNGREIGRVSALTLFLLLMPLGLTFYAWKIVSINEFNAKQEAFQASALESEKALGHRLESYDHALVAAGAFWQSRQGATAAEWRAYVDALSLKSNYPGMNGLGVIEPSTSQDLGALTARVTADGADSFKVHPQFTGPQHLVVTRIEPLEANREALGLDEAFEANRKNAIEQSRDLGLTTASGKITLVQDKARTPGFLLVHPVFAPGEAPRNPAERRSRLTVWIYAPFIAGNLFGDLTESQGKDLDIQIFDGSSPAPAALIYDSGNAASKGVLSVKRRLQVGQRTWFVQWTSTKAYDATSRSITPLLILSAGLLFTTMLAVLFFGMSLRSPEAVDSLGAREKLVIPVTVFLILAVGSAFLYRTLSVQEDRYFAGLVERDATEARDLEASLANGNIQALQRSAEMWSAVQSLPGEAWRADAGALIRGLPGVKRLIWFDGRRSLRWAIPAEGIRLPPPALLTLAAQRGDPTASAIVPDAGHDSRFDLAVPVGDGGAPLGFLVATWDPSTFGAAALTNDIRGNYQVSLIDGTQSLPLNDVKGRPLTGLAVSRSLSVAGRAWVLRLQPTKAFLRSQRSAVPIVALVAGLVIALLSALTVQALLTLSRKSQELLQSNRGLFEVSTLNSAVLASTRYMVVTTDSDGLITSFNSEAERMLGYAAAEVVGKATPLLWHDAAEINARLAAIHAEFGTGTEPNFSNLAVPIDRLGEDTVEWSFVRRDGSRFPARLSGTPLRNEAGDTVGYLGIVENVTERHAAQQALVRSEETFRLAMENAPIGKALVALDGHWLQVNTALCDLLGYAHEELLKTDFQTITHPDDLSADMALVAKVLAGEIASYALEKRYTHKDGHTIWGLLSVSLVRNVDGTPAYFISQIQDITERREMERMKSEFISTVSHELRTPLTSIRGSLDFVASSERGGLSDAGQRLVDMALRNCDRLVALVNDILDIDKIASGSARFDVEEADVCDLLEQAVALNQAFADKWGVRLVAAAPTTSATIVVDPERFQQAMTNLISNAVKFSPAGGVVTVSATTDNAVRFAVKDDGMGIPAAFRPRIFGRFAQADSSSTRSKGGSGLGLHITRELVEHMGGSIGYESAEGAGSTFWISFPCATDQDRGGRII